MQERVDDKKCTHIDAYICKFASLGAPAWIVKYLGECFLNIAQQAFTQCKTWNRCFRLSCWNFTGNLCPLQGQTSLMICIFEVNSKPNQLIES